MITQQWWYYLHRSRQIGPFSWNELQSLLGKAVISSGTLVWTQDGHGWRALRDTSSGSIAQRKRRRNWTVAVVGLAVFLCGVSTVARGPTGQQSTNLLSNPSAPNGKPTSNQEELADRIRDHQHLQAAEIMTSGFGGRSVTGWRTAPPMNQDVVLTSVFAPIETQIVARPVVKPTAVSPRVAAESRRGLSAEARRELEFWRQVSEADDADAFLLYLRRYPSGTFADIATARIGQLQKIANAVSIDKSVRAAPVKKIAVSKMKESDDSPQSANLKITIKANYTTSSTQKSALRCGSGNLEGCRERCREGERRACLKLKRLGG